MKKKEMKAEFFFHNKQSNSTIVYCLENKNTI